LGPYTAVMLRPLARMDITGMRRIPALLTVTTGRIGFPAVSSSARVPGSMAFMAVAVIGAAGSAADVDSQAAVGSPVDVDLKADVADSHAAELLDADRLAAASMAAQVDFAVVGEDSTAVQAGMVAAGIGN